MNLIEVEGIAHLRTIAIVLVETFPLLSLSLVTEPLRLANRESVSPAFLWRCLSLDGAPVRSSSGFPVRPEGGLDEHPADAVLLLSSYRPEVGFDARLLAWLRRRAAGGALMGCVDTGALIFAEAGLLSGQAAAVHHEAVAAYGARHEDHFLLDRLYDLSPKRCSSAGGVATLDMTLALIGHFTQPAIARRVAEILNYRPLESARAQGLFGRDWSLPRVDRQLGRCVEIMIANIEEPLPLDRIAAQAGLPLWRMRRLFAKHLKQSPGAYYQEIRLEKARNLLRNAHAQVGEIAGLCGFESLEGFSRAYRRRYGLAPSRDRDPDPGGGAPGTAVGNEID